VALRFVGFPVAALLLSASLALADVTPNVIELSTDGCDEAGVSSAALYKAIALELLSDGTLRVLPAKTLHQHDATLDVSMPCENAPLATLNLSIAGGRMTRRELTLSDTPLSDRPRAIALAVAEFVRTESARVAAEGKAQSKLQTAVTEQTPPTSVDNPAAEPQHVAGAQERTSVAAKNATGRETFSPTGVTPGASRSDIYHSNAAARIRWFPQYDTFAYGGSIGFEVRPVEARVEVFAAKDTTTQYRARLGSAALGAVLSALSWERSRYRLAGGPRAAIGLTWATGDAKSTDLATKDAIALYADAGLELCANYKLHSFALNAALDVGWSAGVAHYSGSEQVAGLAGPFAGALLGAQF
jgi:hypothetical protein